MKITNKNLIKLKKWLKNMPNKPIKATQTSQTTRVLITDRDLKKEKLKCNECGKVLAELYVYTDFNPVIYNDAAFCLDCGRLKKLKE